MHLLCIPDVDSICLIITDRTGTPPSLGVLLVGYLIAYLKKCIGGAVQIRAPIDNGARTYVKIFRAARISKAVLHLRLSYCTGLYDYCK